MHFTLPRLQTSDAGTFGQLLDGQHRLVCCTLELPWRDNHPDVSCIPPGTYPMHRAMHHDAQGRPEYEAFALDQVPDREGIQIHIANLVCQLRGCIAPGRHFGEVTLADGRSGFGVLESGSAFAAFMSLLAGEQNALLTILDVPQSPPLLPSE